MNKKEIRHEQLSFSFDKEYPSLLEPLRQKENELGTSSTGSVFYRIQMINCYLEEGDFSNAFKCLEKVVKVIFDVNSKPSSNYFRELIHLAAVIDKQISGKAMVDSFDQIRGIDFLNYLYQSTGEMLWAEKNYNEAIKWYRKAADQGSIFAQSQLGWIYFNGNGVERDDREAVKWHRQAAVQGDGYAQYQLGNHYARGLGVREDYTESFKWFSLAAEQGVTSAQCALSLLYAEGLGVEESCVKAYKWVSIATIDSYEDELEIKHMLEGQMTSIQVAEAKELARKWTEKWERKSKPI